MHGITDEPSNLRHHDECQCELCMGATQQEHPDGCGCDACCEGHGHDHSGDSLHVHGSYDPTFGLPQLRAAQDFVTSGGRWTDGGGFTSSLGGSGGTIAWSIGAAGLVDTTGQFFSGSTVEMSTFLPFDFAATLQRAFDAWSEYGDINFVQVADEGGNIGSAGSPTIRVVGGYIDGQDGANTLARAFYPTSHPAGGDIVFDYGNTNFYANEHNFFLTALHEIGHAIGLGHEQTSNAIAIMNPVINTSLNGLQADDIAGIQAVYGAAPAPQPDLVAGNVSVSATSATVGESITVTYDITNAGDGDAVDTTAGVYLSTDAVVTTADTLLTSEFSLASNASGAVDSESVTVSIPDLAPGTYYIGVVADINDDESSEADETNNTSNVRVITIEAADPYPDEILVEADGDVRTKRFDDEGRLESFTFEDGSETRPWTDYTNQYDVMGEITSQTRNYDDGRVLVTTYANGERATTTITDVANVFSWLSREVAFDGTGAITSRSFTYDDGRTVGTEYSDGTRSQVTMLDGGGAKIWTSRVDTFDNSGSRTASEILYDDGRLLQTAYTDGVRSSATMMDVAGAHGYASYTESYDSGGNRVSRTTIYDDGREVTRSFLDDLMFI